MGNTKKTFRKMKLLFLILLLGVAYTYSLDRELQALMPKCNLSKNGRCGPTFGNTICPSGYCSKWWWCGTSALHKSTHQAKYDAKPGCAAKKPAPKCNVSKNGRCGPKYGKTICPAGYCSKWAWCGTSALHKSTHQAAYDAKPACAAKKVVKKAKIAIKKPKVMIKKPKVKITKKIVLKKGAKKVVKKAAAKKVVKKAAAKKVMKKLAKKGAAKKVVKKAAKKVVKKAAAKKVVKKVAPKLKIAKKITLKKVGGKGSLPPKKLPKLKITKKMVVHKKIHMVGGPGSLPPKKLPKLKIAKKVVHKKVAKKVGKKVTKKVHVHVKATKPAKHTKVTKVTRKVGDTITTHVYTVQEEITEVIVPVEEIITVETHRLVTIHTIIDDTSKRIKKAI